MNKKLVVGGGIVLLVLIGVGLVLFVEEDFAKEDMCIIMDVGCCSCSNGGEDICVLKSESEKLESEKNCGGDIFCAAVYSCDIETCEYINGKCIAR